MAVTNNIQLSTDFGGLYLAKETLKFALSPTGIHTIAFSVVLSVNFARKTNIMYNIKGVLIVYIFDKHACIPNSTVDFRVT